MSKILYGLIIFIWILEAREVCYSYNPNLFKGKKIIFNDSKRRVKTAKVEKVILKYDFARSLKAYFILSGIKFTKELSRLEELEESKKGNYIQFNSCCDSGFLNFNPRNGNLKGLNIEVGDDEIEEIASIALKFKNTLIKGRKVSCPDMRERYMCIVYNVVFLFAIVL